MVQAGQNIVIRQVDHCPQLGCDFTRHYFPQAEFMSQNLKTFQTGWFYPPLLAIMLQPLVWLSQPLFIWIGIQIVFMGGLAFSAKRMNFQKDGKPGFVRLRLS